MGPTRLLGSRLNGKRVALQVVQRLEPGLNVLLDDHGGIGRPEELLRRKNDWRHQALKGAHQGGLQLLQDGLPGHQQ